MKIKIFAFDDFTGDVQRSCFRENLEFTGFMNYEGIDNLSEEDKKSCFFIVENEGLVHLFHEHGISDKNVIPLNNSSRAFKFAASFKSFANVKILYSLSFCEGVNKS